LKLTTRVAVVNPIPSSCGRGLAGKKSAEGGRTERMMGREEWSDNMGQRDSRSYNIQRIQGILGTPAGNRNTTRKSFVERRFWKEERVGRVQ